MKITTHQMMTYRDKQLDEDNGQYKIRKETVIAYWQRRMAIAAAARPRGAEPEAERDSEVTGIVAHPTQWV